MRVLELELYGAQSARWPASGKHILAHFDDDTIVVYQAYRPSIARFAVEHQRFGGDDFSFERMSWVKPNFLWMMYRSSWGTAEGQEHVLALRVKRAAFDTWLGATVASTFRASGFTNEKDWSRALKRSDVRLQWDPDHSPTGAPLTRRAVQLGLRGAALDGFKGDALVEMSDISALVAEQRAQRADASALRTPVERVYPLSDELRRRIGADDAP